MLEASYAQAAGGGGDLSFFLIIALLFGVMYFLMIRPQQKRRREAMQMQNSLGPGDEIVTIGGLHGTVVSVADDQVLLEISPGVEVRFARPAIARVVQKTGEVIPEPDVDAPAADAEEPESPATETRKQD
ncbi:preprotein translocase subunit YajC [Actinoplanes sp. NEAU-A12]|uniref:Preprotein translocase subunit YajC n=1 Tax=Actinoplanes sandaracinus TaxID=3045177 RepID=A0ABT6WNX0_9ACTN|nr:preprotein translocase subunit YajC [Actinoplanes sandaracinus]MDI6101430.1 preprotein translocase subunit YajC [Actinoplanes sandaracinus]